MYIIYRHNDARAEAKLAACRGRRKLPARGRSPICMCIHIYIYIYIQIHINIYTCHICIYI